jgi:hypothetical protein
MRNLLILCSGLLAISPLFAEQAAPQRLARDTYYSSGYLIGLNLGQARTQVPDISGISAKRQDLFGRIYVGYNLSHYFALQVGYVQFPDAKYSAAGKAVDTVSNKGFDGLLQGKYPLGEGFSVFGNLGGAILAAKNSPAAGGGVSQNATVLAYGTGLDYVFANIGGLHSNVSYYHTDKKDTNALNVPAEDGVSLGVYYQF